MDTRNFTNLPVYKKALEVFRVSRAVACDLTGNLNPWEMRQSAEFSHRFAGEIVSDSLSLAPNLALLRNTSCSSLRARNAVKIRKAVKRILSRSHLLEISSRRQQEFLNLLRAELHQFDRLFAEWLKEVQSGRDKS